MATKVKRTYWLIKSDLLLCENVFFFPQQNKKKQNK